MSRSCPYVAENTANATTTSFMRYLSRISIQIPKQRVLTSRVLCWTQQVKKIQDYIPFARGRYRREISDDAWPLTRLRTVYVKTFAATDRICMAGRGADNVGALPAYEIPRFAGTVIFPAQYMQIKSPADAGDMFLHTDAQRYTDYGQRNRYDSSRNITF